MSAQHNRKLTIARIAGGALITAGLLTAAAGPASAHPGQWAAIAVSNSGLVTGWAQNYDSREDAEAAAIRSCDRFDCRPYASKLDGCVAINDAMGQAHLTPTHIVSTACVS
ncbi:DUF4189 domain-containing protein [Nocardia sp. NEAU-G5]|uniref:DUF4189 domain-containing protein n=1 Tax=Nocardia albiluteola TaxID=2842303 RepID=A0ABS6ATE1_9NOCA|nr:DUF4189 domain-containing protein [Nocardia albiluteola]MBU3060811.1 DUF4189 domain-containing protein [Nocardia albiluteola]